MTDKALARLGIDPAHILSALNQHAIVSITDRAGNIVFANDEFCAVSGYTREELLGQNHRIINSGLHSPEFFSEMWRTISRGERWQGILRNRGKSGSHYWVQTTIHPISGADGRPEHYVAIRTEITRTKENEAKLDRNTRLLTMLNEQAKALLAVDQDQLMGRIHLIIGEWTRALQVPHAVLVSVKEGAASIQLDHQYPESLETLWSEVERLPNRGGLRPPEASDRPSIITSDDTVGEQSLAALILGHGYSAILAAPISASSQQGFFIYFLAADGATLKQLRAHVFFIEILCDLVSNAVRRVHNERDLTLQAQKLDARQFLAHLGDWDMEVSSLRVSWSPTLFGFSETQARLELADFVALIHAEDRDNFLRTLNQSINQFAPMELEFRLQRDGDRELWVLIRGARLRDRAQQTDTVIATLIDISQSKQTEAELKQAKKQAERANVAKTQFLSNMSHELRTPLNSVLGFGQLLQLDDSLNSDQRENVDEILKSGAHLLNLINEILDLSLIEAGNVNVVVTRTPLQEIVAESMDMVRQIAAQKGVELSSESIPAVKLFTDRTKIKQALINLLSNAIKYNRPAGKVLVSARVTEDLQLHLNVSDTGYGIDPHKQKDLFVPFNRLGQEHGSAEGTGIGLAYTRSVVEIMGGEIGFYSTPGEGSTFYLSFPLAWEREQFADADGETGEESTSTLALRSEQVLLISRSPRTEDLVRNALTHHARIGVRTVEPGHDLEQLSKRLSPGILLVHFDGNSPTEFGAAELRQASRVFADPWVVALLENTKLSAMPAELTAYFDYICLLPMEASALLQTIRSISHRASLNWL